MEVPMKKEVRLLNHIHQSADMGQDSLKHILELSNNKEFTKVIQSWIEEYQKAYQESGELLKNYQEEEGKNAPAMSKMMSNVMSKVKNMMDPSTSKLAEIVLQGATMGITEMTKEIHEYNGKDEKVLNLAKNLLKKEEKNVEEMKKFL